jgi:hypothetical protein
MQWFRLYSRIIDDKKIKLLAFEDRWHFVALCCLKSSGLIDSEDSDLRTRQIAVALEVTPTALAGIKHRLVSAGLLANDWTPIGWPFRDSNRPPAHEWATLRLEVFERDDFTCTYCGERGSRLECDHIMPVSRGGRSDLENLTTSCRACNRAKRDKTPQEWRAS